MENTQGDIGNAAFFGKYYRITLSGALVKLCELADRFRDDINTKKLIDSNLWKTVEQKLFVEWTYNTNAIEGSTLTFGETLFFLTHGLTIEGKPFKDFVDAKNHSEAIELLYDVVRQNRSVSTSFIKEINALLLSGVTSTHALSAQGNIISKKATPGEYKLLPNSVLQSDGNIHRYVPPEQTAPEMEYLCKWINDNTENNHPIIVAAVAHFNMVRIHPFDDGNGRGARLLMNLILIEKGFPPAVIKNENRRAYLDAIMQADTGDLNTFSEFIAQACIDTQKSVLDNLG